MDQQDIGFHIDAQLKFKIDVKKTIDANRSEYIGTHPSTYLVKQINFNGAKIPNEILQPLNEINYLQTLYSYEYKTTNTVYLLYEDLSAKFVPLSNYIETISNETDTQKMVDKLNEGLTYLHNTYKIVLNNISIDNIYVCEKPIEGNTMSEDEYPIIKFTDLSMASKADDKGKEKDMIDLNTKIIRAITKDPPAIIRKFQFDPPARDGFIYKKVDFENITINNNNIYYFATSLIEDKITLQQGKIVSINDNSNTQPLIITYKLTKDDAKTTYSVKREIYKISPTEDKPFAIFEEVNDVRLEDIEGGYYSRKYSRRTRKCKKSPRYKSNRKRPSSRRRYRK